MLLDLGGNAAGRGAGLAVLATRPPAGGRRLVPPLLLLFFSLLVFIAALSLRLTVCSFLAAKLGLSPPVVLLKSDSDNSRE